MADKGVGGFGDLKITEVQILDFEEDPEAAAKHPVGAVVETDEALCGLRATTAAVAPWIGVTGWVGVLACAAVLSPLVRGVVPADLKVRPLWRRLAPGSDMALGCRVNLERRRPWNAG
jgi:hypothetical protein